MISMKVYSIRGEVMVAACDTALLGKVFEDGELRLHVKESFYGGDEVSENEFLAAMESATIANLVGKNVISIAIKNKIINEEGVLYIAGTPHAQMARLLL